MKSDSYSGGRWLAKTLLSALATLCFLAPSNSNAQTQLLKRVDQLEQSGQFKQARLALDEALNNSSLPAAERKKLQFERDRLDRIKKDFPHTKEELYAELSKAVKDLTTEEYETWIKEGRFDSRTIDGVVYFMSSSVSNLYFRYPELNSRRLPPKETAAFEKAVWESARAIAKAAKEQKKPYVLPKRFHVTMTVTAKSNAVPAGETVRAWLPIPRAYPFQGDFDLLSSFPQVKHLDEAHSPIRAVHFEQTAQADRPTEFKVEYNYTSHGVRFDVRPEKVRACNTNDAELKPFLAEGPHVVFTPEIRRLSAQIAGAEQNPCLKAKKFYDWIAANIKYSYAIEYSTIRNISDYCRTRQYGDCGQEALLFITLCRLNGIPARWQSGWNTFPGGKTIHDWSEIYLEPHGWMPVDPYMGIFAMRYVRTLSEEQKREIRDFYFGGLDQYRMAANSDHSQPLSPDKRSMRSDDVDFQRGELEWGEHNIYFDQYSWKLDREEIKLAP